MNTKFKQVLGDFFVIFGSRKRNLARLSFIGSNNSIIIAEALAEGFSFHTLQKSSMKHLQNGLLIDTKMRFSLESHDAQNDWK